MPDSGTVHNGNVKDTSRKTVLPYGRQCLDDDDIAAVVNVLRSPMITTGPQVEAFEEALAAETGTSYAVAVSSGTAALHSIMFALDIEERDEVVVPTMTFAATANAVVYQGGKPVFADVDPDTLLIGPEQAAKCVTPRTKAIIAVDYAGQPCDYDGLRRVADQHDVPLVSDSCHSLGGRYKEHPAGSLARMSAFSFHPVKHVTTGEGGAVTTDDAECAERLRLFRNHGINNDYRQRQRQGSWFYEMVELGYNYRITDIQCALGLSQLKKLRRWIKRRQEIAQIYDDAFESLEGVTPLRKRNDISHAYHLYVIRIDGSACGCSRSEVFTELRASNIGVNVHYVPVHLHPYYRERFGCKQGDCPVAESAYKQLISVPMFPGMSDQDTRDVITVVRRIMNQ